MEQKLINAYCAALVQLSREGTGFAVQANAMLRELSDPINSVHEMLSDVERMPSGPFEFHLRATARGMCYNTSL